MLIISNFRKALRSIHWILMAHKDAPSFSGIGCVTKVFHDLCLLSCTAWVITSAR
jgi:hypothetical protein